MKHVPVRTCAVCREQKDKRELLRIVRSPDGAYSIDETGRAPGRGAYVCRTGECMRNSIKKRAFNKVFKAQLPQDFYDSVERFAGGANDGTEQ